jgi:hypothetical protein
MVINFAEELNHRELISQINITNKQQEVQGELISQGLQTLIKENKGSEVKIINALAKKPEINYKRSFENLSKLIKDSLPNNLIETTNTEQIQLMEVTNSKIQNLKEEIQFI